MSVGTPLPSQPHSAHRAQEGKSTALTTALTASARALRYVVAVDGHGWQASLASKLLLGSTVLSQRSHYPLWYQPRLRNGTHAIVLSPTLADLPDAVRALRRDDATARRIARRGADAIERLLSERALVQYTSDLLRAYAEAIEASPTTGEGAGGRGGARLTTESARGLYREVCEVRSRWYCTHAWPAKPPGFEDRS